MSEVVGNCWSCGHKLVRSDYGRESLCLACGKPAHVCRNCRWFAPGRPNDCFEPMVERILDKTRANFCGYFEPVTREAQGGPASDDLRRLAESLFK
ncbi:MAG: hypothetical protein A2286_14465 [Gammaproteobacteria bacterium RIFOXYA12_FULL_61_12]|nr:MAG: hypothetical protein A2514_05985 [Gammaproteobacteria bacterium RIFOXYD12_FULL_61_37]OGT92766.1 MAG: hypothetical protein A2286_14465 [Gammaproteobacteria bacterium RIFOXYA12_FULL_61_12]